MSEFKKTTKDKNNAINSVEKYNDVLQLEAEQIDMFCEIIIAILLRDN
jgi:hypothetical protein